MNFNFFARKIYINEASVFEIGLRLLKLFSHDGQIYFCYQARNYWYIIEIVYAFQVSSKLFIFVQYILQTP